ncbi:MAG: hypothetical protein ACQEXJ_14975 [Myxococcota bacterium]
MSRRWTTPAVALAIAALQACGGGGSSSGTDGQGQDVGGRDSIADGSGGDVGPGADGEPSTGDWSAPQETNDWRVVWNYRGRLPSNENENELWISDPGGALEESITDLSGLAGLEEPLSCNYGCVVSPDLQWLAVATGPPDADGFDFRIGKFDANLHVNLFKGVVWEDMIDFQFAGQNLFYSQKGACTGPSCQYDIWRVDLEDVNNPVKIATYPTEADLEDSSYKGHFKVSPDGRSVVFLNTTIRSVQVHMWREQLGLVELDFVCKHGTKGNCSGTGSEYTDEDPVAISPDGRWIVFFTFSERWQRARIYDIDNPGVVRLTTMASVEQGSFIEHACDPGVLADWQWEQVIGDPVFTPDGEEVVFLTATDCGDSQKPRTNLRRVELDTLLAEEPVTEEEVFDITDNPFGDVTDNRRVTGFDLAPDGATIAFTATPEETQSGDPIQDGSSRQRNDRELYRVRLDGTNMIQLTNHLAWQAESPRIVPPAPE